MAATAYDPPVDRLLALGEGPARAPVWPDYVALGLTRDHLPALLRMAGDAALDHSADEAAVWAPVHAWRALGQLGDAAVTAPLLDRLADAEGDEGDEGDEGEMDDEFALVELPLVLGMLGPEALPALTAFLGRRDVGPFARGGAAEAIAKVGQAHPATRAAAVNAVAGALAHHAVQDQEFNSILLGALLDLEAVEAAPQIEAAFAADAIDPTFAGDWEDVQLALGLLDARRTPRRDYFARSGVSLPSVQANLRRWRDAERQAVAHARRAGASRKAAKAKRRQAAQSRRRNRRK